MRQSYIYDGNSYTVETTPLYSDLPLFIGPYPGKNKYVSVYRGRIFVKRAILHTA